MRDYIRRLVDGLTGTRQATIDTIEPGRIVVAPRRPIDRFDVAAIAEVLDLATKVGAVLLDSGTGAIDTQAQIRFVAATYGLDDVQIDVTFNTIHASARRGATLPPITTLRTVEYRSMDFTRLAHVDKLIRRIRDSAITPGTAHQMLDTLIAAPHPYSYRQSTFAWGLMAAGVSMLFGGDLLVALIAFVTTSTIVGVNHLLRRIGTPKFFQQVTGGFIAVVPAALIFEGGEKLGVDISPSQVIASGIVVLLSGLSLVGSVQDAITGAPITGAARFFELVLMTGGIIAGVGMALRLLEAFGVYLPTITAATEFRGADIPAQVLAGAVAALAFAWASYAERRALPMAFIAGAIGVAVVAGASFIPVGNVIGAGMAAVCVGMLGGLLARRALTPPLVVAIAGITPLLPGLAVYRGLYGILNDQSLDGFTWVASALGAGCALAAGVTLGEFIARTLRRPRVVTTLIERQRSRLRRPRGW
ncbi:MAG: threonine/serine exporter family protein [Gordonia sp. (in: high G+C Gram-positive bacteria)]